MTENFNINEEVLGSIADELAGFNELAETMPFVQWFHDPDKIKSDPDRGGFVFVEKCIELAGDFLNLQTISDYAKENNISYNGAKKFRNNIELFGVKFVIEND